MKEIIVIKFKDQEFDVKVNVEDIETKNVMFIVGVLSQIIHNLNVIIKDGLKDKFEGEIK